VVTDVSILSRVHEDRLGTDDGNNNSECRPEDEPPFLLEHHSGVLNSQRDPGSVKKVIPLFRGLGIAEFPTSEDHNSFYHGSRITSISYILAL
jgi:hypothetical protein